MSMSKRVNEQRKVVLEQLKANSDDTVFELLVDILSVEREYRGHSHGRRAAVKAQIERVADHDLAKGQ